MKKIGRDIGLLVLILIMCGVVTLLYVSNFGKGVLFTSPRDPDLEVPVIYTIGWWAEQKALTIDDLKIEILESKLNMFNPTSLVSYKIKGHLTYKGHWQPVVEEVHISERLNTDTTLHYDRIVEITPVVKVKKNNSTSGGTEKFEFRNEHLIHSNQWGINRINFICGHHEQVVELLQKK